MPVQPDEPVAGALFLLDVFLGLAQLLFGNDFRFSARLESSAIVPSPGGGVPRV